MANSKSTAEKMKVMQAFLDGEEIEFITRHNGVKFLSPFARGGEPAEPQWDWVNYDYRIASKKPREHWILQRGAQIQTEVFESKALLMNSLDRDQRRMVWNGNYRIVKFLEVDE